MTTIRFKTTPHFKFPLLRHLNGRDIASHLLLMLFVVVLFLPLFFGKTLYWGDISLYFSPMQEFAKKSLQSGVLPLWNPYLLSGQPFLGNPQISLFYPTTGLLFLFSSSFVMNASILFHVYLCGAFAYVFLRRHTVLRFSAFAGACIYMGGSFLLGRVQFPPVIQTASFFPLLILLVESLASSSKKSNRCFAGIAFTVALVILAAHAQTAYLIFLCSGIYFFSLLSRQIHLQKSTPAEDAKNDQGSGGLAKALIRTAIEVRAFEKIALLAGAFIVGITLAAAYLLPTLQLLGSSPRTHLTLVQANRFYMDFPHLAGLIFPHFAGHPATGDYFARGNAWEPAIFIGWIPLALIWLSLAKNNRNFFSVFWGAMAFIGVWLSLGMYFGLFSLAFYALPGLASFHDPARFLLWSAFAFSILTALGFDACIQKTNSDRRLLKSILLVSILAPLWWFGKEWNPVTEPANLSGIPAQLETIKSRKGTGRTAMIGANTLWKRYVDDGYDDYSVEAGERRIQEMRSSLLSNLEMEAALESATGYEPVPILSMAELDGLSRIAQKRGEPNYTQLMKLMDVSLILQPRQFTTVDSRLFAGEGRGGERIDNESRLNLWVNRDRVDRFWLVRRTRNVEGKMRIASALASPDFKPEKVAIVSTGSGQKALRTEWGGGERSEADLKPVVWKSLSQTHIEISADAGSSPAFLVCSMTAYPGWKAIIDGRSVPVIRTNGSLIGVAIPQGSHRVEFVYAPASFRFGLYLTLATLFGVAFCSAIFLIRRTTQAKTI